MGKSAFISLCLGFGLSLLLAISTVPTTTYAKNTCVLNGCGPSGWWGNVVPDSVAGCNFRQACDSHDTCYSRCAKCGDLKKAGSKKCNGSCEEKRARKDSCDLNFHEAMIAGNPNSALCKVAATAYYLTVSYRGCSYFRGVKGTKSNRKKFQKDFEAILSWLQNNPEAAARKKTEIALRRLSQIDASDANRLHEHGGRLGAVAEGLGSATRGTPKSSGPRVLMNGLDITRLKIDGKPFNTGVAKQKNKNFNLDGINIRSVVD